MIPSNYDYLQNSFLSSVSNTVTDAPKNYCKNIIDVILKLYNFAIRNFTMEI